MAENAQTTQLAEVDYLLEKIEKHKLPEELKDNIDLMLTRVRRMARQGRGSEEYEFTARYVDWVLRIPWFARTKDVIDLSKTKQILDARHYGSENVKQTILEYLAVLKLRRDRGAQAENQRAPLLVFTGPQGTGKTTIAKSIAESMGRVFQRISLGGISSASEIRGVPKGEMNSGPGQIVKTLAKAKSLNPVILLDEIDKTSGSKAVMQDFMAILLEVLDPQQNKTFRDLYVDYPIDLSQVMFIATANTLSTLTTALLDRMEIVEFKDYTHEEKQVIAEKYLMPKIYPYAGLAPTELQFSPDVWPEIIKIVGDLPGIRTIERSLERMSRKVAFEVVTGQSKQVVLTKENIGDYLSGKVLIDDKFEAFGMAGLVKQKQEEKTEIPVEQVETMDESEDEVMEYDQVGLPGQEETMIQSEDTPQVQDAPIETTDDEMNTTEEVMGEENTLTSSGIVDSVELEGSASSEPVQTTAEETTPPVEVVEEVAEPELASDMLPVEDQVSIETEEPTQDEVIEELEEVVPAAAPEQQGDVQLNVDEAPDPASEAASMPVQAIEETPLDPVPTLPDQDIQKHLDEMDEVVGSDELPTKAQARAELESLIQEDMKASVGDEVAQPESDIQSEPAASESNQAPVLEFDYPVVDGDKPQATPPAQPQAEVQPQPTTASLEQPANAQGVLQEAMQQAGTATPPQEGTMPPPLQPPTQAVPPPLQPGAQQIPPELQQPAQAAPGQLPPMGAAPPPPPPPA